MTRPNRLLTIAATTILLATASTVSAAATVPPEDKVVNSDLPTVAEVAEIYPVFEGGDRSVRRNRTPDTPTKNCLYYRQPVEAAHGKWSSYTDADGGMPYFDGYEDPGAFVYKFETRRKARTAYRVVRRHHVRCEGRYEDADGSVRTRKVIDVPEIGQQHFAIRTYLRTPNALTTWSYSRELSIWFRQGRYLVEARVQAESYKPHRAKAFAFAQQVF